MPGLEAVLPCPRKASAALKAYAMLAACQPTKVLRDLLGMIDALSSVASARASLLVH